MTLQMYLDEFPTVDVLFKSTIAHTYNQKFIFRKIKIVTILRRVIPLTINTVNVLYNQWLYTSMYRFLFITIQIIVKIIYVIRHISTAAICYIIITTKKLRFVKIKY